jgi:PAS domain S-box-containing protein
LKRSRHFPSARGHVVASQVGRAAFLPAAPGHPQQVLRLKQKSSSLALPVFYARAVAMEDSSLIADWILDQIADAVIYANRSGAMVRWNRASTELFGRSAEEALGRSLNLIIPEHLRASHWRGFETAMTSGVMKLHGRPTLTRALHKSGRKLYVVMTFAIVKCREGEVLGSVAVTRDVTERMARERAAGRTS